MSDSRLQEFADQIDDLTDIAQGVLRAEISRRGMDKKVPQIPGENSVSIEDALVGIWQVKDTTEAESVMGVLESAGIPAVLGTEQFELVDGGHEDQPVIKVVIESRPRALELLNQYFPQAPDPEEDDDRLAVCPHCHSPDIILQNLDSQASQRNVAVFNWSCEACGHQWKDTGLEQLA